MKESDIYSFWDIDLFQMSHSLWDGGSIMMEYNDNMKIGNSIQI